MTTGVARMWYNHIWLIQLLETTFTSRYCAVPYFKTCNLTNGNWLCYCVSILRRRILTAENHTGVVRIRYCKRYNTVVTFYWLGCFWSPWLQAWWKLHCASCLLVFYFVRLCGAAGVGCEVSEGKKPSKPIHILTALFTTRIHKENKQILPYQPTLLKTLANTIYCMCLFQHGKQQRNYARTSMVKIALRKLFAGILCGCVVLLVGYEVSDEKKKHPNLSIF